MAEPRDPTPRVDRATWAFAQGRIEAASQILLRSVRAVGAGMAKFDLTPAGSAVLLSHEGKRYIVTAAHVLDLYEGRPYFIGTDSTWVQLPGSFRAINPPAGGREADVYDFAFAPVSEEYARGLEGCEFLTAAHIGTRDTLVFDGAHRSKYVAFGYPLNRLELKRGSHQTTTNNLAFISNIAPRAKYTKAKLDPRSHILLEFDASAVMGPKGAGPAPMVAGLSGGGIFRVPGLERRGDLSPARLSAITIEHRAADKLMVGVRIDVVLEGIGRDTRR
jgi:hypothetical protein